MKFGYRALQYIKDTGAVLTKSNYEVVGIDFCNLKACVNKIDHYKKRNGKSLRVEHYFEKWIPFTKDMISYGQRKHTDYVNSIYASESQEQYTYTTTEKYLNRENKQKIINEYSNVNKK